MQMNLIRKGLVIGIMVLFVGASVIPSISGNIKKDENSTFDSYNLESMEDENILSKSDIGTDDFSNELETFANSGEIDPIEKEKIMENIASSSLYFTENNGQFPEEVLFQVHASGSTVYLCRDKIVSVFTREIKNKTDMIMEDDHSDVMDHLHSETAQRKMERISISATIVDANKDVTVTGKDVLPHYNNYFIGNDSNQWYTNVSNYQEVVFEDIYPNIDLRYYSSEGSLKYDFIVNPGADPYVIKIRYEGVNNMRITSTDDLQIESSLETISEKTPVMYQLINGMKQIVHGGYELRQPFEFGFYIGSQYNPSYSLVIDPMLVYSTYLGGTSDDKSYDIALDDQGYVYITGETDSSNFPMVNPYDGSYNGYGDAFVAKFSNVSGIESLVYSTYLGGSYGDSAYSIAIDEGSNIYIAGHTYSSDFPLVNPYSSTPPQSTWDLFITKISSSGNTLLYSTYYGGTTYDYARGIAIDAEGNAYVTGETWSSNLPMVNSYDSSYNGDGDAFVAEFSPTIGGIESLVYSTYLGGSDDDRGYGIAADEIGNVYATGYASSSNFPTVNAFDDSLNGLRNAFVVKLSPYLGGIPSLVYSTYLGGTYSDTGWGITVDDLGCSYVTGRAGSDDFPLVNPYDDTFNGGYGDVFVTKFSPTGNTLLYSTYLGGTDHEEGHGIAIDDTGNAYVYGWTHSVDFPMVNSYDDIFNGGFNDVFIAILTSAGNNLSYSTYFGGTGLDHGYRIAVDATENMYVSGYTLSVDIPMINSYDSSYNGGYDVFVAKFTRQAPDTVYVDDDYNETTPGWGYDHFDNIQDGIDAVNENGTVFVFNGTYYENVDVNKTVNLIGEDKSNTIIDGGGSDVILISVDWVDISQFTIRNGDYSVKIHSSFNSIVRCDISGRSGILLISPPPVYYYIYNNSIIDNIITAGEDGIFMSCSNNTTISGNSICNASYGLQMDIMNHHNVIENNVIYNNSNMGILLDSEGDNYTVSANIITDNGAGIWSDCADNKIIGNIVRNNDGVGIGVTLTSNRAMISDNIIDRNGEYGIFLWGDNCTLHTNIITNNSYGMWFFECDNNIIFNNIIKNNSYGIYNQLMDGGYPKPSNNNLIYHNNFIINIQNAYDECNNFWFNDTLQEGNYWSDFDEPSEGAWDHNSDGIVDFPYDIPGGDNQDLYPLMIPHDNHPPNKPNRPSGPLLSKANIQCTFTTQTEDLDGDQVYYMWDFGDGTTSGWLGPYESGEEVSAVHAWTSWGKYFVKVKAKDIFDFEGPWSKKRGIMILPDVVPDKVIEIQHSPPMPP